MIHATRPRGLRTQGGSEGHPPVKLLSRSLVVLSLFAAAGGFTGWTPAGLDLEPDDTTSVDDALLLARSTAPIPSGAVAWIGEADKEIFAILGCFGLALWGMVAYLLAPFVFT